MSLSNFQKKMENNLYKKQDHKKVADALRSALIEIFYTETIGHCHVDEAVEHLLCIPRSSIKTVLSLVRLISFSVSDLLAFSFMENVGKVVSILDPEQMHQWVIGALSIYESQGLQPAKEYLENASQTALKFSGMQQVVELEQMASRLGFLAAGLTGRPIGIKKGTEPFTDTDSIYLPATLSVFSSKDANRLLYRMMAIHKCAQIRYRSFYIPMDQARDLVSDMGMQAPSGEVRTGLEYIMGSLKEQEAVAMLCFVLCDTIRIEARLERDFPGLSRDLNELKNYILSSTYMVEDGKEQEVFNLLTRLILKGNWSNIPIWTERSISALVRLREEDASAIDVSRACFSLLQHAKVIFSPSKTARLLPYMGVMFPDRVGLCIERRRQEVEKRFVEIIGALLLKRWQKHNGEKGLRDEGLLQKALSSSCIRDGEKALAMLMEGGGSSEDVASSLKGSIECLFLDIKDEKLRFELQELLSEIKADLGSVPMRYISSAVGFASSAWTDVDVDISMHGHTGPVFSTFTYDEWDFRRQGYRQNWCLVKELEVPGTGGDFVEKALRKHRGQLALLLRQFEMLRPEYRFLKRQAEGEDIDIDAVVEAWADIYAQRSPSEYLFIRQMRQERNIAVLFLVDMSASTEGWINQAIKEALILLCQCMELLDDKYAICGFSGMRRTSCHFFRIKDFDQPYDEGVKSRIGGINPRDYTRMGPAIRHATMLFREVEARLRILVTLSDGKPEDYDEYKGPYAVEDTRRALLEAREEGIKPFCITIDKEARDYLSHMYGEGNYIFIQDVGKLHRRVAEIYRLLTT